jgi:periplasmic protein CpxP/Spy
MSTTRSGLKLYVAGLAVAAAGALTLTAQAAPFGPGGGPGHGYGPGYGQMMGGGPGYGPGAMMGGGPGAMMGGGPGAMMGGGRGAMGMHGGPGLMLSDAALDRIHATPEQRAQLRKIAQDAATQMQAQRAAGDALREQMRQAFTQPSIDANAVEALRQQMLAHHDQASKLRTQSMLDASRVLTAEQRKLLADTAKQRSEMRERHRREWQQLQAPKS